MSNVIVQIQVNRDDRAKSQKYEYSRKSWSEYAKKNGLEYFVLEDEIEGCPLKPQWYKLFIPKLLDDNYARILYVDSDTIVHPKAPNIFDLVADDEFGVVRNYGSMEWVCRSCELFHIMFNEIKESISTAFTTLPGPLSPFKYFNSGLMLFNKQKYEKEFDSIIDFVFSEYPTLDKYLKYYVGNDQPILNYFSYYRNFKMKYLPYEFNMQDMHRFELLGNDMLHTKMGWVYHFNAGVKPSPGEWMSATYKYLNSEL